MPLWSLSYLSKHARATLERFWRDEIDPKLRARHDAYVVDFALLSTGDVVVVELNPFDEQTGGGRRPPPPSSGPTA